MPKIMKIIKKDTSQKYPICYDIGQFLEIFGEKAF